MCNNPNGCDCPMTDSCRGCYWNKEAICCPVCGNIEIEDNYCIICGHKLKEG